MTDRRKSHTVIPGIGHVEVYIEDREGGKIEIIGTVEEIDAAEKDKKKPSKKKDKEA